MADIKDDTKEIYSEIDENYVDSEEESICVQIDQCYRSDDAVLFQTLYEEFGDNLYQHWTLQRYSDI